MTQPQRPDRLAECRLAAKRLLRQFRSSDASVAALAAARFRELRSFADAGIADLIRDRDRVQLRHALAVIAKQEGASSWKALKVGFDAKDGAHATAASADSGVDVTWYGRGLGVFLNRWYVTYEEARAARDADGGYLLPYRNHYFVCTAEAIRALGLDPEDADWRRIGYDAARPADAESFANLCARRRRAEARIGARASDAG